MNACPPGPAANATPADSTAIQHEQGYARPALEPSARYAVKTRYQAPSDWGSAADHRLARAEARAYFPLRLPTTDYRLPTPTTAIVDRQAAESFRGFGYP
jgi:hypothetical protein